jgi:hypothetical protein
MLVLSRESRVARKIGAGFSQDSQLGTQNCYGLV